MIITHAHVRFGYHLPVTQNEKERVASTTTQISVFPVDHPGILMDRRPLYGTPLGACFVGDAQDLLSELPSSSIDLVVTSPPYALHFKKEYGNVSKEEYLHWFSPFAAGVRRVLKDSGSFVLVLGGSYNAGEPTRSLYHFKLLIHLVERLGFHLAQECFWYNPAKMPTPAEWVNVRRVRIKDSVEYVWWLSKTPHPRANNANVLVPYSKDMKRLIDRGLRATQRPSGHHITQKFLNDRGGAIPSNFLEWGNNDSNSAFMRRCRRLGVTSHPARFPRVIPDFFIRLLTSPGDTVLDIFSGSNTTGAVAEQLERTWLAFEIDETYARISALRFDQDLLSEQR